MKPPGTVILSQYFDKLYPLASGLFYTSSSIGLMVYAPFTQVMLETYGWRGTLLILGAINFNFIVCCVLFRPLSQDGNKETSDLNDSSHLGFNRYNPSLPSESDNEKDTTFSLRNETSAYEKEDETWIHPVDGNNEKDEAFELRYESVETKRDDTWVHLLGLSLFKNFSFIAVCLAMACFVTSVTGWTVYFIPHCLAKGLTPYEAKFAASFAGFAYLIGHLINIPFLKWNLITVRGAICLSGFTAGIILFVDKFMSTFVSICITNSIYTCGIGVHCLIDVHMKAILDQNSLAKAFGWRTAVGGLCRALPGFLIGKFLWTFFV